MAPFSVGILADADIFHAVGNNSRETVTRLSNEAN